MSLTKQGTFADDFATLADRPNKTADEMKALFQSQTGELKDTVNNMIDALEATTDGASGADQIGATAIPGWDGDVVQEVLESAKTDVDGKIPKTLLSVAGDMMYASAGNLPARLAKGTAYQHLGMNSGATAPEWQASAKSVLTAQGDIMYASAANTPARLAKGTAGQLLQMNSGATAPEWSGSAWASWTPTVTWTTATPGGTTYQLARYRLMGNICFFNYFFQSNDGNGATAVTISLPVTPKNNGGYTTVIPSIQRVATTYTNPNGYIIDTGSLIQFFNFSTCTDGAYASINCTGMYEI